MGVSWSCEGTPACRDSHISPGPQQKGAEQQQEDGREDLHQVGGVWWRRGGQRSDCLLRHRHLTRPALTAGSGPDGDTGGWPGPLPGESAHRQHVLPARLQTVQGGALSSGVRHQHVEQIC